MMRFLRNIVCISAALLTMAAAGPLFALDAGEAVAPWESAEDARIAGDAVVDGIVSPDSGGVGLNAFCDSSAFERVQSLRERARRAVSDDAAAGIVTHAAVAWKDVLERVRRAGISRGGASEKQLITGAHYGAIDHARPMEVPCRSNSDESGIGTGAIPVCLIKTGGPHPVFARGHAVYDLHGNPNGKVNLAEYAIGTSKIDSFRLFCYLWEGNPKVRYHIYHFLPASFRLSHSAFFQCSFNSKLQDLKQTTVILQYSRFAISETFSGCLCRGCAPYAPFKKSGYSIDQIHNSSEHATGEVTV